MPITAQQAKAELARRELERRGVGLEPTQEQPQTLTNKLAEQGNWVQSGLLQTAKDVGTIPAHYVNQLALNLPRAVANKFGIKYPETENPVANVLAKGAGVAGALTSPVGKAIQGLGKLGAGMKLGSKMLQGAKVGAITGAAYTPTEDIVGIPQRFGQAATGAATGGLLTGLGYAIAKGKNWLNPKNQLKLADETRNSLTNAKNTLIEKYGEVYNRTIKQGQGKVSLQEPLLNLIDESDDIVNTIKGNSEISEALAKGDPTAKKVMNLVNTFIEKPKEIPELTLQEADGLQKYIRNLPGIRTKLSSQYKGRQVDFTNAERVLLGLSNDIKAQVMNQSPEMNLVNKEYGQFMSNYKQIRPYLKWNNAITSFKNIHQLDPAVLEKIQQTVPKEVMNKILTLNRTERAAKLAKWIGGIAAGGYVTKKVLSK